MNAHSGAVTWSWRENVRRRAAPGTARGAALRAGRAAASEWRGSETSPVSGTSARLLGAGRPGAWRHVTRRDTVWRNAARRGHVPAEFPPPNRRRVTWAARGCGGAGAAGKRECPAAGGAAARQDGRRAGGSRSRAQGRPGRRRQPTPTSSRRQPGPGPRDGAAGALGSRRRLPPVSRSSRPGPRPAPAAGPVPRPPLPRGSSHPSSSSSPPGGPVAAARKWSRPSGAANGGETRPGVGTRRAGQRLPQGSEPRRGGPGSRQRSNAPGDPCPALPSSRLRRPHLCPPRAAPAPPARGERAPRGCAGDPRPFGERNPVGRR